MFIKGKANKECNPGRRLDEPSVYHIRSQIKQNSIQLNITMFSNNMSLACQQMK